MEDAIQKLNSKFLCKTYDVSISIEQTPQNIIEHVQYMLRSNSKREFLVPPMGMVLIPIINLVIPIQHGELQIDSATRIDAREETGVCALESAVAEVTTTRSINNIPTDNSTFKISICGFFPKAKHMCVERQRPIDQQRLEALDTALLEYTDVTGSDLLSTDFEGTPPARIYRSFVAPKPTSNVVLDPLERVSVRVAEQIALALRQLRADQSALIRNGDKTGGYNDSSIPRSTHPIILVLDNIRSAFNVGSMFRTAETGGAAEIVTCGITAHPPHPKLQKTALSATEIVPCRHFDDVTTAVQQLRDEGFTIMVMETTARSKLYTEVQYPEKVALVVGNEVTGVDPRVIELADGVIEIPTYGVKNSLNVASAAPIVLFEVLRQWNSININSANVPQTVLNTMANDL